jgi:hypothetical protein
MGKIKTFRDIINLWGPRTLAGFCGVGLYASRKWAYRDSIPPEYWLRIVSQAKREGHPGVTLGLMAKLSAAKLEEFRATGT